MIILDTNFILSCVERKIDFSKEDTRIPYEVIKELEKIVEQGKKLKYRKNAETGLEIIKKTKLRKIKLDSKVDAGLVKLAEKCKKQGEIIKIATNDKELKNKLKNKAEIISISDFRKF